MSITRADVADLRAANRQPSPVGRVAILSQISIHISNQFWNFAQAFRSARAAPLGDARNRIIRPYWMLCPTVCV